MGLVRMNRKLLSGFVAALLCSLPCWAAEPALQVAPARVELAGADDYQQLLISDLSRKDRPRDVTKSVTYASSRSDVAYVTPDGLVRPKATGEAQIIISHAGQSATVAVTVKVPPIEPPVHFANDVMPILSKHGCNAGGCHGKASGQNGFKLSLFGADPEFDYNALVREGRGRRLFPAAPERSLLLMKAAGQVPHGGGKRIEPGSLSYNLVLRWMRQGVPVGNDSDPTLKMITVEPGQRVLERKARQQIVVRAHFSDGTSRDVTRHAEYQSNEVAVATVDDAGLVTTQNMTGETAIMTRYLGQVAVFRATVPRDKPIAQYPDFKVANAVDDLCLKKWRMLNIAPSPPATDAEFLRRAFLDVCGTLPTPEETRRFLASNDSEKRAKLIDHLLDRREYSVFFALKWADILRNAQLAGADRVSKHFQEWLRQHFAENRPYDQLVRGVVAASGRYTETPGVNWLWQMRDDLPWQPVADTAQVFLGTRINCAQCHHHPFEKWSQDDYYGFAGFYGRLQMVDGDVNRLYFRAGGNRADPRTNKSLVPKPLDGPQLKVPQHEDPRDHLVDWMSRPDNPFFAKALVNRYWAHFMGRGLVEPIDDMRDTNPPSNPELLDALAKDFIASNFDIKRLVRTICTANAYGLSSAPTEYNADDRQNHARYYARRVQAEVLLDMVDRVTRARTHFGNLSQNMRAIDLPHEGFGSYFLDVFGRPPRTSGCECARGMGPSLAQALHLLNAPEIEAKLVHDQGRAARLAADKRPDRDKVEELYLAAFSRPPNVDELKDVLSFLNQATDKKRAYRDLLWALLNTREFAFNH